MIKEIYFRDPSDSKFIYNSVESYSELELVLNKVRMILLTKKGEVLGEPELGLDLEDMLFDFTLDEYKLRQSFYAQVQKYITESNKYDIDLNISSGSDGVQTLIYLYITIDNVPYLQFEI